MKVIKTKTAEDLGREAALLFENLVNKVIEKKGVARVAFSTGASQFTTFEALLKLDIDWSKVEMFHLDEYVNLPITHIASFRKYLRERFVDKVNLKQVCYVGELSDPKEDIARLTKKLKEAPIDIGFIGIGENAHIAFNDPPADFDCQDAYKVVVLSDTCKKQQVREGWFATLNDVPKEAISMTVSEIMRIDHIISSVPNAVKAQAIFDTLSQSVNKTVPATILKNHKDTTIIVDENSGSMLTNDMLKSFC